MLVKPWKWKALNAGIGETERGRETSPMIKNCFNIFVNRFGAQENGLTEGPKQAKIFLIVIFQGVRGRIRTIATAAAMVVWLAVVATGQQTVVDKTVATVSDGVRTELITYSDLRWQLALQPNTPINPPSSDDLNRALRVLIDQRLFALEAERLPREAPNKEEINEKINEILDYFPSSAEFERRLKLVGFKSVSDPSFEAIIAERIAIDKYLAFRFRSFIVITAADEAKYYREVYVPEFRRLNPGRIVPSLESERVAVVKALTEERIAQQIEAFLDEAKRRAQIVILNPV